MKSKFIYLKKWLTKTANSKATKKSRFGKHRRQRNTKNIKIISENWLKLLENYPQSLFRGIAFITKFPDKIDGNRIFAFDS